MAAFDDVDNVVLSKVLVVSIVFSFFGGLVLGVPVVGRELEAGTATTAWSMSPSRRRWFARRMSPILGLALLAGAAVGAAAWIVQMTHEGVYGSDAFRMGEAVGMPLLGRVLAGFGIGVLAGVVLGRALPAFIVGLVAMAALVAISMWAQSAWLENHLEVISGLPGTSGVGFEGVRLDQRWLLDDGRIVSYDDAVAVVPPGTEDPYPWLEDHLTPVQMGVPDRRAPEWRLLETAGLVVGAAAMLVGSALIVDRRRPV